MFVTNKVEAGRLDRVNGTNRMAETSKAYVLRFSHPVHPVYPVKRLLLRLPGVWRALLVSSMCALAGCSGGGGSDPPPTPMQPQAPIITGLQDQMLPQDTTSAPLPFTVSDPDSAPNQVNVSAQSSDEALISAAGIVLGGDGGSRTIQIMPLPEVTGSAVITVRATDRDGLATERSFRVQVNAVLVSFRDTVNELFGATEADEPRSLTGITLTQDADDDAAVFDPLLQ